MTAARRPRPARLRSARALAAVAVTLAAACTPSGLERPRATAPSRFDPAARGHLVIAGGGPLPQAVTAELVALAGGRGRARILVLPLATADTTAGARAAAAFHALGAVAWSIDVPRAAAERGDAATLAAIDSATGIWLPGGDQNRIMAAIGGTPVAEAIRRRYAAGAVVGGTSAGAAVMSATMITGEERRPGGARPLPADSRDAWVTVDRGDVVTAPGLGLLRAAVVDQHFLRRRRHNRLLALVLERAEPIGIGVDESTALVVEPTGRWRVVGESVVLVYDGRAAHVTRGGPLGGVGVALHVLTPGSTYDPRTSVTTFP